MLRLYPSFRRTKIDLLLWMWKGRKSEHKSLCVPDEAGGHRLCSDARADEPTLDFGPAPSQHCFSLDHNHPPFPVLTHSLALLSMLALAPRCGARAVRSATAVRLSSSTLAASPRSLSHLAGSQAIIRPTSALRSTLPLSQQTMQRRSLASEAPQRGNYAELNGDHVSALASFLSTPQTSMLTTITPSNASSGVKPVEADELASFNVDWMNKYKGRSACVIKPKSTKEVSDIVAYCSQHRIAVVPQGGNTGLVGGGVPVHDEVVINLSAMNNVRSFDAVSGEWLASCIVSLRVADTSTSQEHW